MDIFFRGYNIINAGDKWRIEKVTGVDKISASLEFSDIEKAKDFINNLSSSLVQGSDTELVNIQTHIVSAHKNIGNLSNRLERLEQTLFEQTLFENKITELNKEDETVDKKSIDKSLNLLGKYIINFESAPNIIKDEEKLIPFLKNMVDCVTTGLKVLSTLTGDDYNWERTVSEDYPNVAASESMIVKIKNDKQEIVSPNYAEHLVTEFIDVFDEGEDDELDYQNDYEIDMDINDSESDYLN